MRILFFLLISIVLLGAMALLSGRWIEAPEAERIFDLIYASLHRNFNECMAVLSLAFGIWNSVVRRRLAASAVFFLVSFVFSILVPFGVR